MSDPVDFSEKFRQLYGFTNSEVTYRYVWRSCIGAVLVEFVQKWYWLSDGLFTVTRWSCDNLPDFIPIIFFSKLVAILSSFSRSKKRVTTSTASKHMLSYVIERLTLTCMHRHFCTDFYCVEDTRSKEQDDFHLVKKYFGLFTLNASVWGINGFF